MREGVEILVFFDFVISGPTIYDYKSAKWKSEIILKIESGANCCLTSTNMKPS